MISLCRSRRAQSGVLGGCKGVLLNHLPYKLVRDHKASVHLFRQYYQPSG